MLMQILVSSKQLQHVDNMVSLNEVWVFIDCLNIISLCFGGPGHYPETLVMG